MPSQLSIKQNVNNRAPTKPSRTVPYSVGSQVKQVTKPTASSSKVFSSIDEAARNRGARYRGKDGKIYELEWKPVKGVKDTWQLSQRTEIAAGRAQASATNSGKRARSSAAYQQPPVGQKPQVADMAAAKINRIKHKGQQFHHMMDLSAYKHIFAGLDPKGIKQLTALLNKNGFFPGDDRRNYIGLVGNGLSIAGRYINGIRNSEHQGDIHPRLDAHRRANPVPSIDQLIGLTPSARAAALLPGLEKERSVLQQVIADRRRGGLQSSPSANKPAPAPRPSAPSYGGRTNNAGLQYKDGSISVDPLGMIRQLTKPIGSTETHTNASTNSTALDFGFKLAN